MARTFITSFDSDSGLVDGLASNTLPSGVSYDTITPDGVGKSLKFLPASGSAVSVVTTPSHSDGTRIRARFRFTVLPATARIFVGSATLSSLRINPDGTVGFYTGASTLIGTSAIALTDTSRWYTIEWLHNQAGGNVARLRIEGVDEVTTADNNGFQPRLGCNDTVAATYTMYVDDLVYDNAAFPGEGAVRLLLPISDSARAALWVAGSNATTATTNLFEGVNNTPPIGTATSIPVANGISHEGGAAGTTDDYDANMTSYSTAGIGAGSTINAVQAVVAHAEDIATGAKLLTFSVKSNPAQGAFETNFTAGNGSAAGTYPTNWVITRGTIISGPSVTLGTSPVMTMRRPETASRRADVCFMGIYVDYTPVAGDPTSFPPVPPVHPMMHLLVR
jgi:hypothetical protein